MEGLSIIFASTNKNCLGHFALPNRLQCARLLATPTGSPGCRLTENDSCACVKILRMRIGHRAGDWEVTTAAAAGEGGGGGGGGG